MVGGVKGEFLVRAGRVPGWVHTKPLARPFPRLSRSLCSVGALCVIPHPAGVAWLEKLAIKSNISKSYLNSSSTAIASGIYMYLMKFFEQVVALDTMSSNIFSLFITSRLFINGLLTCRNRAWIPATACHVRTVSLLEHHLLEASRHSKQIIPMYRMHAISIHFLELQTADLRTRFDKRGPLGVPECGTAPN